MRLWGILVMALIWLACPAFARPAVVTAGEHAGFTRVVIQFGGPVDWQLGRDKQGYRLRILTKATTYDLENVFKLIKKTRLTATSVDPATGDLMLSLSCHCFAMPYEERLGVVVVDLRDGDAAAGSSFELPLELPELTKIPPKGDYPQPAYDWSTWSLPATDPLSAPPMAADLAKPGPPLPALSVTLEPMRLSLIQDISRGASQGLVDMIVPDQTVSRPAAVEALPTQIEMRPDVAIWILIRLSLDGLNIQDAE